MLAVASSAAFAGEGDDKGYLAMSSAFAIAIAAFGGAFGQGKAASSALEGIARNPAAAEKIFTPMIIALALIESLVIYAFVIAFLIKP
ncbi:MAG: ATP synthase F0 subunit C [Bacteriovoracaceae bacterium]